MLLLLARWTLTEARHGKESELKHSTKLTFTCHHFPDFVSLNLNSGLWYVPANLGAEALQLIKVLLGITLDPKPLSAGSPGCHHISTEQQTPLVLKKKKFLYICVCHVNIWVRKQYEHLGFRQILNCPACQPPSEAMLRMMYRNGNLP